MNTNKILIASLAGGVVHFVLGYLIWETAFGGFFASNTGSATGLMKDPPVFWAIGIGSLAAGALLAVVYGRWASIKTFSMGATAGAIIGFLLGLSYDFISFGTTNAMSLTASVVDVVLSTIFMAVIGGVVGWTLGQVK